MFDVDLAGDAKSQQTDAVNRRSHQRIAAENLANLGARLASGAEIRLIDLSRGGAQFECDRRFLPNSTISLRLVTPDATFVVSGRVVRSRIVRLDRGGLGYNVAVSFNELLQHLLEVPPPASDTDDGAGAGNDGSDVTAEEAAAFDATADAAPGDVTVTASLDRDSDEVLDLFNGNDW